MVLSFFVPWCEDVVWAAAHTSEGKHGGRGFVWVWGWFVRFAGHGCVPESARGWCWLVCMPPRRAFPPVSASSPLHHAFPPVSASSFTHRAFPPVSASSPLHRAFSPVSAATLYLRSFSQLSLPSLAHSAHLQPLHFKVFLPCGSSIS